MRQSVTSGHWDPTKSVDVENEPFVKVKPGQRQDGLDSGLRVGRIRSSDVQNEPSVIVEPKTQSPPKDGRHPHPMVKSKFRENLKSDTRGRHVYGGGYDKATTTVKVAESKLQQHLAEMRSEEGVDLKYSEQVGTHISNCPTIKA